jgi:ferredoxin--NADP+ reductase
VLGDNGDQVEGQYVVGWIKRGPSGVIGTNKKDAQETVDHLFEDLDAGRVPEPALASTAGSIEELLAERAPETVVSYQGWEAIDAAERGRGEPLGRPRLKFCRIDEMVEASRTGAPVAAE